MTFNSENRNNVPVPPTRSPRRCSFCHSITHVITACYDTRLLDFEILCARQVVNIDDEEIFKEWLTLEYISNETIVKVFAMRKCGVSLRRNLNNSRYIDSISAYIFRKYKNIPAIPQSQIINRQAHNNYLETTNRIKGIISTIELVEESGCNGNVKCNICWDDKDAKDFIKLSCDHEFCKVCVLKSFTIDQTKIPCCAFCRTEFSTFKVKSEHVLREFASLI